MRSGSYSEALALIQGLWAKDRGFVGAHASRLVEGLAQPRSAGFADFLEQEHTSGKVGPDLYQSLNDAWNGSPELKRAAASAGRDSAEKSYTAGRYGECAATLKENFTRPKRE